MSDAGAATATIPRAADAARRRRAFGRLATRNRLAVVAALALLAAVLGALLAPWLLLADPDVVLALAIVAGLGPGLRNAMVAIAIVGFPIYTRLVRGVVLSLREREFVEAARALGASDAVILGRHVLPHLLSPVIVAFSLDVGAKILATAGLSFLGLGTH